MGLVGVGTWKYKSNPTIDVKHAIAPYCYRCPLGLSYPSCGVRCAQDVQTLIQTETSGQIAAFIAEPIQGVGGVVTPPPEYFQIVYDIVRRYGGLCIADEVQTGLGRTGHKFWGFENWGVIPDAVTMAKGLGNGTAIGAFVTRTEIAQALSHRVHFNTFGGNPVAMTYGLATLEVIDSEGIQDHALRVGTHLKQRLLELQARQPLIGDVRGLGLLLGVELVRDRATKEPAVEEADAVLYRCLERGLSFKTTFGNVLTLTPPLIISEADIDRALAILDAALAETAVGLGKAMV
jgi:4-aminobutyrate aminotransferase-like enzyme